MITAQQTQKCGKTKSLIQALVVLFNKTNTQTPTKTWFLNIKQNQGYLLALKTRIEKMTYTIQRAPPLLLKCPLTILGFFFPGQAAI